MFKPSSLGPPWLPLHVCPCGGACVRSVPPFRCIRGGAHGSRFQSPPPKRRRDVSQALRLIVTFQDRVGTLAHSSAKLDPKLAVLVGTTKATSIGVARADGDPVEPMPEGACYDAAFLCLHALSRFHASRFRAFARARVCVCVCVCVWWVPSSSSFGFRRPVSSARLRC